MRFQAGTKVSVNIPVFGKLYYQNEWMIDHIKTQTNGYPSLYVCYNVNDKHKTLYQFLEADVEKH